MKRKRSQQPKKSKRPGTRSRGSLPADPTVWLRVDWRKPDGAIARQLNVTTKRVQVVRLMLCGRSKRGQPTPDERLIPNVKQWQSVDWRQNDDDIARRLRVKEYRVQEARLLFSKQRKRGLPKGYEYPAVKSKWLAVDWNLSDTAIARKLNLTRQRVHQKRLELGKPRPPDPPTTRKWVQSNHVRIPTMTAHEAASESGFSVDQLRKKARGLGLQFRSALRAGFRPAWWRDFPINWDLPSSDLEQIWQLPKNAIGNARSRGAGQRPRWTRRRDSAKPEYQKAIRREKQKARRRRDRNQ